MIIAYLLPEDFMYKIFFNSSADLWSVSIGPGDKFKGENFTSEDSQLQGKGKS